MYTPEKLKLIKLLIAYLKSVGKEIPKEYEAIAREMEKEEAQWRGGTTSTKGK